MNAANPREPSLPEKILAIDGELRRSKIAHAFGGALALAYYSEPRATIDIDVNVFIPVERFADVAAALANLGVNTEVDAAAVERDGQCRLWWGRTPIDLFFSYDDLHRAMKPALRRVTFANSTIAILSPDHLIVCKAFFDRAKDWIDIEQMLVAGEAIDRIEIEHWLALIVGKQSESYKRFERLADDILG